MLVQVQCLTQCSAGGSTVFFVEGNKLLATAECVTVYPDSYKKHRLEEGDALITGINLRAGAEAAASKVVGFFAFNDDLEKQVSMTLASAYANAVSG